MQEKRAARTLVTGATGFIGQRLVSALVESGAPITLLVRPSHAEAIRKKWSQRNVTVKSADLADASSLAHTCDGIDRVFHLAAYPQMGTGESAKASTQQWKVTVEGTQGLVQEAKQLVFTSSVKAMGEGGASCLDENSAAKPVSEYGKAKLAAETIITAAGREHVLHTTVLRLPLVYGTADRGSIARLIAAMDRGKFPMLPDTGNKRSMIHVDDVVRVLLRAAEKPQAGGQVYIVTDGRTYSTREICDWILQALGKTDRRWSLPLWVLRAGARAGDLLRHTVWPSAPFDSSVLDKLIGSAWYSSQRIEDDLGFRARWSLPMALPDMIAEYRARRREHGQVKAVH
jgi:nucleoside-diphosphate-sugar epimerase